MAYEPMVPSPEEAKLGKIVEKRTDAVAKKVDSEWLTYRQARTNQENVWQRAQYNLDGRYMTEDLAAFKTNSKAFVQITMPRVQTAVAMLVPVLIPNGDTAWTLDPTPEPKNPAFLQEALAGGASMEEARMVVRKRSEKAAEYMSIKILDGLAETGFNTKFMDAILEGVAFGTMVMTGPFVVEKTDEYTGETYYCPEVCYESVWDTYVDPAARCVTDSRSVIFRKPLSVPDFRDLRKKSGFNAEVIDEILQKFGETGNWTPEWWEQSIKDANGQLQQFTNGRYTVLVRWGYLSGREMREAGAEVPEDLLDEQIMCQSWVCDSRTIYVANSELHRDRIPVYMVPYRKKHFSPWGMGIPESMFDSQDAINACERSKLDNMALSAKPQAVIYPSMLVPGHNHLEIASGKIWPVQASEIPGLKPVDFINIPSTFGEVDAVQQRHFQFIQEQTAIPNFLMGMGGEGVHNRTSSGAAMQFNSAVTPLKSVVFNVENYLIIPLIEKMAKFYRMYDASPELEGDYKVVANGLQGLLNREALSNMLLQLMQIAGTVPAWSERLDIERIQALLIKANGLTDEQVVLPDSVIEKRREEAAKQQSVQQLADAEAQAQLQSKVRAETSPRDVMLEVMKRSGEGPVMFQAMRRLLADTDQLDPELEKAINDQMEFEGYRRMADVTEFGARQAELTNPRMEEQRED